MFKIYSISELKRSTVLIIRVNKWQKTANENAGGVRSRKYARVLPIELVPLLAAVLNFEKVGFLLTRHPSTFPGYQVLTGPKVLQIIPSRIALAPRSISSFNIKTV